MKKWVASSLVGLFVIGLAGFAHADQAIKLVVNGQLLNPDVPARIENDRTIAPVRPIAEALGAKVIWDGNTNTVQMNTLKPDPIVIYSIPNNALQPPIQQLPNYESGNIVYSPIVSDNNGHQPWRMDPFLMLRLTTTNLVPENIVSKKDIFSDGTESENVYINHGVTIKLKNSSNNTLHNSSNETNLTYEMIVPHVGSYDMTVQKPQGSVFFITTKIVFYPNSFN